MSTSEQSFKSKNSFEKRKAETLRIRERYPDRVPCIVERAPGNDVPLIDKNRFLVPLDLSISQFLYVIRKRLSLPADKAIFLFVNNVMPAAGMLMREAYKEYAEADHFVYFSYTGESVYGDRSIESGRDNAN